MRGVSGMLAAVLVLIVPASAASKARVEFTSREAVLGWVNDYRHGPEPARVPAAVKALSALGILRDPETCGVYVGFLAGVIAANPGRAEELIARMLPLPAEHQWVVVRAIAYSGLPEWKALLRRVADRLPARQVMIERTLAGKLPTLDEIGFAPEPTLGEKFRSYFTLARYSGKAKQARNEPTPDLLDTHWGYYYATGVYRPMARIIALLPWSKDRDDLEKLTLGSMAKYTLAINAARNPDQLAMLKWAAAHQPPGVVPVLEEVVEAAETADTFRLRKAALASIEELKRKGPGSRRELSFWGQVGEGALALGCIAAAVAGQVEFGLPCVIGGAATSAALRFWERQP
jgi:hypothetical protein